MYVCNFIYMNIVGMEFVKIIGMEWKNKPLTLIHMAVCCGIENYHGSEHHLIIIQKQEPKIRAS